jgi:predicted nucleic acid-binding protein
VAVFVDTTVWIAYFSGALTRETDHLDRLLGAERIVTGDLVVAAVLAGYSGGAFATVRDALASFEIFPLGSWEAAVGAAADLSLLRREHAAVATAVHALIAASCRRRGSTLLHADPAFLPFEDHLGLRPELPRRLP